MRYRARIRTAYTNRPRLIGPTFIHLSSIGIERKIKRAARPSLRERLASALCGVKVSVRKYFDRAGRADGRAFVPYGPGVTFPASMADCRRLKKL